MSVETPLREVTRVAPELDPEIEAGVIEDARARQRRQRRIGGILIASAVAAGALFVVLWGGGGGAGAGGHTGGHPSGPGHPGAHIAPQTSVSQAVVDFMVPTNGAQVVVGVDGVDGFLTQVQRKETDACLAADGFPPPSRLAFPAGTVSTQLPDLTYIRSQHSTGVVSVSSSNPTGDMSKAEKRAYASAVKRCNVNAPALAVNSSSVAISIFTEWGNFITRTIATNPAVRAANQAGAKCSKQTAFPASSYEAWLTNSAYMPGGSAGSPRDARGADVFLRCFGPAVMAVDRELARASTPFLARSAQAIRLIQNRTAAQVASIAAKYDVPFERATKPAGR